MRYKILTIDDSKVVRTILKQALAGYDCSVYEGSNGEEGLEVAFKIKPDLILLDIDMSVMNGWDTLASLRFDESFNKTPVIMLTANDQEENVHRAEALGVSGFLTKPFQLEEIIRNINKFIQLSPK